MIRIIDTLSEFAGKFSAWMFFLVGFFITYEVFMRYVFTLPTIWVDEVSRITQIWAAYLAAGYALKYREMVVIDVAFRNPASLSRKIVETFALIAIATFCYVAIYYGIELWWKATVRGHTTDTYLALPKWFTQASVWFGFLLLFAQTLAEMVKIWTRGIPEDDVMNGAH
jgi:C4-dicarboxylate transporter, DctQ subunit